MQFRITPTKDIKGVELYMLFHRGSADQEWQEVGKWKRKPYAKDKTDTYMHVTFFPSREAAREEAHRIKAEANWAFEGEEFFTL